MCSLPSTKLNWAGSCAFIPIEQGIIKHCIGCYDIWKPFHWLIFILLINGLERGNTNWQNWCIWPSNSFFVFPYLIWMWYFHIWSNLRFFREIRRGWSNQHILQNQGAYPKQLLHKILPPLGIGPYLVTQGWGEQILSYYGIRYSPQSPPLLLCPYKVWKYEGRRMLNNSGVRYGPLKGYFLIS